MIVRYDLPFGLNAAAGDGSGPTGKVQVVVGADGKEGGEKVGDILRQTTYWRGKQPGIFDVSKNADNFDLVVQAVSLWFSPSVGLFVGYSFANYLYNRS